MSNENSYNVSHEQLMELMGAPSTDVSRLVEVSPIGSIAINQSATQRRCMDILENILNFKRELLKVTRGESDGTIAEAFSMLDAIEMKFNPLVENSELWGDGRWSEPSTEITIIYRLLILVGYNASIRNLLDSLYMVTHDLNSATINLSSDDILVAMNNWKRYNASCIIERRVYVHYINAAMREAGNTVFTFAYDRECAEKECTKHLTTITAGCIYRVQAEIPHS